MDVRFINMTNLVVFKGKPGVGKTYVSDMLAEKLDYFIIHKDDINNLVFEAYGANKQSSDLVYSLIEYFSRNLLEKGKDVVIDCSLSLESNYLLFKNLAQSTGAHLIVVEVLLPDNDELEKRLNSRTDLPEHRIKTLGDIKKQGLMYENYEIENLITIENSGDVGATINDLVGKIN